MGFPCSYGASIFAPKVWVLEMMLRKKGSESSVGVDTPSPQEVLAP